MTTGEKIRELRIKNGLNQKEFAELFGVGHASVSNYERGVTDIPEEKLKEVANTFSVNVSDLIGDRYENKTEEGYSDPTANAAIKNVDVKTQSPDTLYSGNVYGVKVGKTKEVIIAFVCLNWDDEFIYGFPVYRNEEVSPSMVSHMFKVGNYFYADLRGVKCYSRSRITKELFYCGNYKEFNALKQAASAKLGLPCSNTEIVEKFIEVPVEKVVEKIVEVPVEAKEISNIIEETTFKLLKQRAEIYEDICNKLLASRGGVVS